MRVAVLLVLCLAASAAAAPGLKETLDRAATVAGSAAEDPGAASQDPAGAVDGLLGPDDTAAEEPPGFADGMRDALAGRVLAMGAAGLVLTVAGLAGFALVTRHISPKEALRNPQRAMLYGYVRGHPGVHLKSLSEEFAMKTSSILWHIRKLEAAELVRSERANGFRVFYPVEGGIEIRRVSRAITALHNANARRVFETVRHHAGEMARETAERIDLHPGTVRWHLRKLRDFGLVEELVRDDGSRFYPTPLGRKALETLQGAPVEAIVLRGAPTEG